MVGLSGLVIAATFLQQLGWPTHVDRRVVNILHRVRAAQIRWSMMSKVKQVIGYYQVVLVLPVHERSQTRTLLLTTYYSLLTTHYSLLTTHYLLLASSYSLLAATCYLLLATYYLLLTTYCILLATRCLLLTAHHRAYCLLLTATGLTATGLTATGLTATGLTATGLTATGLTATGLTATGLTAYWLSFTDHCLPLPGSGRSRTEQSIPEVEQRNHWGDEVSTS